VATLPEAVKVTEPVVEERALELGRYKEAQLAEGLARAITD